MSPMPQYYLRVVSAEEICMQDLNWWSDFSVMLHLRGTILNIDEVWLVEHGYSQDEVLIWKQVNE